MQEYETFFINNLQALLLTDKSSLLILVACLLKKLYWALHFFYLG